MAIDPEDYRRRLTASGAPVSSLDDMLATALAEEAAKDAAAWLARVVAQARRSGGT